MQQYLGEEEAPNAAFMDELEEVRVRSEAVMGHCRRVQEFARGRERAVFESAVAYYEETLDSIRKSERRVNKLVEEDVARLQATVARRGSLKDELLQLRDKVKAQIEHYDMLTHRCQEVYSATDEKTREMTEMTRLQDAKRALERIKRELREVDTRIGILQAGLISEQHRVGGKPVDMLEE